MSASETDTSLTNKDLVQQALESPEFLSDARFTTHTVHSVTIKNRRVRLALRDYLDSLDTDGNSPLRQGKDYHLGELEVHFVESDSYGPDQFAREMAAMKQYVHCHILAQRITEAAAQGAGAHAEFAVDEREKDGATYLKFVDGNAANAGRAVITAMLTEGGLSPHGAIRQVGEIETDEAVLLSGRLPIKHRPLLGLREDALHWLSGLDDKSFFAAYDRAAEKVAQGAARRA